LRLLPDLLAAPHYSDAHNQAMELAGSSTLDWLSELDVQKQRNGTTLSGHAHATANERVLHSVPRLQTVRTLCGLRQVAEERTYQIEAGLLVSPRFARVLQPEGIGGRCDDHVEILDEDDQLTAMPVRVVDVVVAYGG